MSGRRREAPPMIRAVAIKGDRLRAGAPAPGGRHWRDGARGHDHKAVPRWHAEAVGLLVVALGRG